MLRGLYTSALSMTTQMKKMDVVTNNMANVDTTGFKKDTVVTQPFSNELMKRVNDPSYTFFQRPESIGNVSLGVFVQNVHTDFSSGSLKQTNGDLDLSISGKGFFAVSVNKNGNNSENYTRDGSFTLSPENILMTKDGFKVMGQNGEINIPNGIIKIDEEGNVYSGDSFIDKLKIVDFENKDSLRKIGNNIYKTTDESKQQPPQATIVQGFLESSNVSSIREMVDMISVSRVYEANQKIVTIHDSTLARTVNDIARKQ